MIMLPTLWQYLREEVWSRARPLVFASEVLIAILVAAALASKGDAVFHDEPKVADLAPILLSYAAIALGFCVAGLTVSLTLPDRSFAEHLVDSKPTRRRHDSYSDLLFVFSWTAICHWFAIVGLVAAILVVRKSQALMPYGASELYRWLTAVLAFTCVYSFFQFLITLITLSQVGTVYIQHLRNRKKAPTAQQ